uniref:RNA-directed DNA polymerase, eukaryota n=1 Tax=Tanacetum cinerariifolium TaxID=118510 RepID=A0A6L2M743_TANCI|nr:hypothetical protein [Tanacetum cinerariifolium]
MIIKVDFAKAYDSIRCDFLDDVLISFDFGFKWRSWIRGSLSSGKASILVNESLTPEFHFHRGLKQGDPLVPFLFLLIMESLHLSFSQAVEARIFIGMSINIQKSHLLGVGIPDNYVAEAAKSIGCSIMKAPFKYLGILVCDNMSSIKAWDEAISKMKKRLSRWKLNTLSVGGRLTLLKSMLGSTPIYNMSIFKVPKYVLNLMESLRRNFFNGIQDGDRKITWVNWSKVLASKKYGGLGVSTFYALNRALLFKWVWHYLSHDNSLWSRVISAIHGLNGQVLSVSFNSTWSSIINEVNSLKDKGVDLISHYKIRVGKEEKKHISVADKMRTSISFSFRRPVRGGVESQQHDHLSALLDSVNVFAWKLFLDRLPTRSNLARRNVSIPSLACPLCDHALKDSSHLFFGCFVAKDVQKLIFRWWNLDFQSFDSFDGWLSWFKSIRLGSKTKDVLEGVFYVSW